ncbi:HNH endonuclease signature motif containing protein [Bacillus sp. z60-18]|uniref:HNH endonuclease signature motif containing protein n=2 Tax=Bacillaceae TaxID=186817 RepID=UPI00390CC07F
MTRFTYEDGFIPSRGKASYKPVEYEIDDNGCWVCVSHRKSEDGYVTIRRGSRRVRLHRYVYEREIGPLSENEVVMHKCDNPPCFNPKHLTKGTNAENTFDRNRKGRQAKGERNSGAKLTEEDVIKIRNDSRSLSELSKEYGVSSVQIRNIKKRKAWKHVREESA